jgi:cell division protein FtsI/penicillin-binding protein 2
MTGFNKIDPTVNPCIQSSYPAASIFKIVTASAAVEAAGLSPDSSLVYNGRKHTLYKSQLKRQNNRHSNHTTLRDSFAQSINPVFGKIGSLRLGKTEIEKYAEALGFNREIPFDLPLKPSELHLSDEPYRLAEVASGFNRETTLSPLHGAVIVATLLNGGQRVTPTIVDRITDPNGAAVYNRPSSAANRALAPETSEALRKMMTATISAGTGKRAFRGYRRDKVLSRLTLGGKTGSIFNKAGDARFDWFVGYAQDEKQAKSLAVSVVVAHEEYIGTRAAQYARMVMREYFADYFAKAEKSPPDEDKGV